jgi:hypothetical protein
MQEKDLTGTQQTDSSCQSVNMKQMKNVTHNTTIVKVLKLKLSKK